MSVKINVRPGMQQLANDRDVVEVNGKTVGECLNQLVEQFPAMKNELFDAAKKMYNQGDYEGAVKLLKDFIVNAAMEETQKQNVAEAYYLLAKIYHIAGDDAQTEANLKKVFKVFPPFL